MRTTQVDVCLTSQMANQIELWTRMYENRSPWVNNKDVLSANLAPAIASEIARLVTLELKSEVTGGTAADYLNEQYQRKVIKDLRRYVEYGCAKGGLVMKPYITQQGIEVQFVQADCFFPLSFDSSGRITQCVFTEQFRKGQKIYTRLEVHTLQGKRVHITNRAFVATNDYSLGSEVVVSSIDRWSELVPELLLEGADRLLFGYFKVPLANADDSDSPLGVSVFSRAVDLIREADRRYSNICWEYEGTQLAVHIATSLLKYNQDRDKFEYPGGKERLYRNVEYNTGAADKPFIDTFSPEIRDTALFNGFNNQLKLVEFNCNLAYGTLSDPQSVDKTATEIKTSKQRSYVMVSDTQMALQDALEDLVYAMSFWSALYGLVPASNDYEVSSDWDDSVMVDAETEREQDRKDVAMGVMRLEEYRAKYYGETLEEAVKNLPEPAMTEE